MPSSRLIRALPSRTCDGCGEQCLAHTVALHGEEGFCQRCAYERAMQCLGTGKKHGSNRFRVAAALGVVALGLGSGAVWWGWNTWSEKISSVTAKSAIAIAPGQALTNVISLPATPIP